MKNSLHTNASVVFHTAPAVFAVGTDYQIMVTVKEDILFWVEAGGQSFYDHSNGVIRSKTRVHRAVVPTAMLDKAGEYTLCYRRVADRKGSFPVTGDQERITYPFKPLPVKGKINIYQIPDAHQIPGLPHQAGGFFGDELDLLVINGDIFDECNQETDFDYIYQLASQITQGEKPIILTKGNHDNRGYCAELMADYTPTDHGRSYYTVRLGRLWMLVLDCGECCDDDYPEYGNTVCHSVFRREETEFIKKVIASKDSEYKAEGVDYRIVISHAPFTHIRQAPYNIERELFAQWTQLINDHIRPHFILSGHLHILQVSYPGGPLDTLGQACPVIIGARPVHGENGYEDYIGSAVVLDGEKVRVQFTNSSRQVVEETFFNLS